MKNCKNCNGTGRRDGWTTPEGTVLPSYPCLSCEGRGTFADPNVAGLVRLVMSTRKGAGLITAPRQIWKRMGSDGDRAYYVWRMARFHGGQDVRMPIMAGCLVSGDPYVDVLDRIADRIAKVAFGTDRAAAYRWGNLLVGEIATPSGLPPSSYAGGPDRLDSVEGD